MNLFNLINPINVFTMPITCLNNWACAQVLICVGRTTLGKECMKTAYVLQRYQTTLEEAFSQRPPDISRPIIEHSS